MQLSLEPLEDKGASGEPFRLCGDGLAHIVRIIAEQRVALVDGDEDRVMVAHNVACAGDADGKGAPFRGVLVGCVCLS